MVQNRSKLIDLFIGNASNAVLHRILEISIDNPEIAGKYRKEIKSSFEIAKAYREKINPIKGRLPEADAAYIKKKIIASVMSELKLRISKGYENVRLDAVEETVDNFLKETNVA